MTGTGVMSSLDVFYGFRVKREIFYTFFASNVINNAMKNILGCIRT